jgi:hypothetical protein
MNRMYVDLQIKPWDLDLFAKKVPLKPYWVKSEFQWNGVNFEALFLQIHKDFDLGQHIKFVELYNENKFY